jgi:Ring finger domain
MQMEASAVIVASDSESEDTTTSAVEEVVADAVPSVAEGVARMPQEEPRNESDLPSGWIQSTKPTRLLTSGRFSRPLEEPPVDGYVWNNTHGVWVPSGRYLEEIKKIKMPKPRKRRAPPEDSSASTPMIVSSSAVAEAPSLKRAATAPKEEAAPEPSPPVRSSKKKMEKADPPDPPAVDSTVDTTTAEASSLPPPELEVTISTGSAVAATTSTTSPLSVPQDTSPELPSGKKKSIADDKDAEDDSDDDDDDGFHPNSIWQEPNTNDLTLYEQHRAPRPAPTGTFICSMDALRQEFRCAICLDILRHARIVRECLHRFCESCMEQALTFQNVEAIGGRRKECPICRVYIPSRRSLAPDPYINTFIARLLDNLVWEEENDPQVYLTSPAKQGRPAPTTASGSPVEEHEPEVVATEETQESKVQSSTSPAVPSTEDSAAWKHTTPGLIHIHLIQGGGDGPTWDDLEKPYITVAADAPTRVIQNFLRRKHGCDNDTNVAVWTIHRTRPYIASEHDSLHYLLRHRTDAFSGQYLPLYYSSRDTAPIVKRGRPRVDAVRLRK